MDKTAETNISTNNKIGLKDGLFYAFGDAGNLLVLTFVSMYLKVFYSDVLAISPGQISMLLLLTRLWDCVNDPLWGLAVARIPAGPTGKYRRYINKVAFPLALSAAVCFFDFSKLVSSQTAILATAYISYTLFGMLYTAMNIPYGSLASVITDDPHGRNLLSTFRSVGGGLGGGIVSLIAPLVVYRNNVTSASGMVGFGAACAALAVIFYLLCHKGTKERIRHPEQEQKGLISTYSALFRSRAFVALAISGFFISGQLQFNSFNQYLYKNYFENTSLSLLGTLATYVPMAALIAFMPKLSERFGKKELCAVGTALSAAASILVAVVRPGRGQWLYYMIILFIIGLGYSFVSITNWAVVTDVIDYQQYKTGRRDESAIYAVYTFSRKLGQTAADAGGSLLLGWAGYSAEIADLGYVAGVGDRLMTICTVVPAVIYSAVFVILAFLYPLGKKQLVPIYQYIRRSNAGTDAEVAE